MSDQKLVVISFDAMVREDITNTLKDFPHFKWMLENGAQVNTLRSVYPTITYPVHASITTGVPVGRHGVLGNEIEDFGRPGFLPWRWDHKYIDPEAKTIFEYAKAAGLSTASIFWPVTANNPYIDYLIPEIWTSDAGRRKVFSIDPFRTAGTRADIMERIARPNEHYFYGDPEDGPTVGNFSTACGRDFIRLFKPDVLFIHIGFIDYARHTRGMFSDHLTAMLPYAERYLGTWMETAKEFGTFDQTNWVILSDHGQIDIDRGVALNVLFARDGFIRLDADGNVAGWDCWLKGNAASALVFLKDRNDKALERRVFDYLTKLADSGEWGIGRVYTADEARDEEGLYGGFSFVIEGDGHTGFTTEWKGEPMRLPSDKDYRFSRATHGYQPDKGPQPPFLAAGPAFKKGAYLERRSILDVAPTLARAMGFEMPTAEGRVMEELLK